MPNRSPSPKLAPRRKRIRLAPELYRIQGQAILVTVCVRERRATLTGGGLPTITRSAIESASRRAKTDVLAWCLMPDHLHALVSPLKYGDVVLWIRLLKGVVAAKARLEGIRNLWQRSFHDRLLREEEHLPDVVRYVLENPVRARLVQDWKGWPHSGFLAWDLSAWLDPA